MSEGAKFEVSNSRYAEFLNAVAATDTNGLYIANMADPIVKNGGITQSGGVGELQLQPDRRS